MNNKHIRYRQAWI